MLIELLSNVEQRQIKIIQYISSQQWTYISKSSIKNIHQNLSYSNATILKDIQFLQDHYHCFRQEDEIYQILSNLDSIVYEIFYDSQFAQIVESIFYEKYHKAKDLSEQLGISPSVFSQHMKRLNTILDDQYHICIHTSYCEFRGSEFNIHRFLFNYFYEKQHRVEWPFNHISQKQIIELHKDLEPYLAPYIRIKNKNSFYIQFIINLQRNEYQHSIFPQQMKSIDHLPYQEIKPLIENHLNCTLNKLDMIDVFSIFQLTNYYRHQATIKSNTKEDFILMLDTIEETFCITTDNREELIETFSHVFNRILMTPKFPESYLQSQQKLIDLYQQTYPAFYQFVKNQFKSLWENTYNQIIKDIINQQLLFHLFTHWDHLFSKLHYAYPNLKVLFVPNYSQYYSESIVLFIQNELPDTIEIDIYDPVQKKLNAQTLQAYDLIISQISITQQITTPIVHISEIFEKTDYRNCINVINHIYQQQRQYTPLELRSLQ